MSSTRSVAERLIFERRETLCNDRCNNVCGAIFIFSSILQQTPLHDVPHPSDGGVWGTHWIWMIVLSALIVLVTALVVRAVYTDFKDKREN